MDTRPDLTSALGTLLVWGPLGLYSMSDKRPPEWARAAAAGATAVGMVIAAGAVMRHLTADKGADTIQGIPAGTPPRYGPQPSRAARR